MKCLVCGAHYPESIGACPACLANTADSPVVIGGNLELGDEIGRGGMGTVYKALHRKLGRTVAVKFLPDDLAGDPEFRARFEREARALAMLNHPNIVAVHDFGQEGDECYLVMEYVAGGTLAKKLPMAREAALPILIQVCDALSYAHKQGVVHRDIKPDNILLDGARAKVSDFGIARIVHPSERRVTASNVAVGTADYLAPEARIGAEPDPRQDIYAMGVVIYEVLTGRMPIGNFDALPAPLDAVVRRALMPDAAARYQTADDLKKDLEAALAGPTDDFPAEEHTFLRAVALLQSISTAVAMWAALQSFTPKVIEPDAANALIAIGAKKLADGKLYTLARFELWWTLATLATFAVAITAYGFLRMHWRHARLERSTPDTPVAEAKWVWRNGLLALVTYLVLLYLEGNRITVYIPVLGGLIEVAALFFLWVSILQAWRTKRPLRREPMMWIGFGISVVPPVIETLRHLPAQGP